MLVDDPMDYEGLHELSLKLTQDMVIHITEEMLLPGYSGV